MEQLVYHSIHYDGRRLNPAAPIILVTRFNLWSPTHGQVEGVNYAGLDQRKDEWESARLAAFNAYCLPSVLRLSLKPDKWYVLFDETNSPLVEAQIAFLEQHPWIVPLRIRRDYGFTNFDIPLRERINADFPSFERLIYARLDSDDSLHTFYFEALEAAVERIGAEGEGTPEPYFVNYTYGLICTETRFNVCLNVKSQFLVSVENSPEILGPYCDNHKQMDRRGKCIELLTERPMWCQHMHGENIGMLNPTRYLINGEFSPFAGLFGLHKPADIPNSLPSAPMPWLQ